MGERRSTLSIVVLILAVLALIIVSSGCVNPQFHIHLGEQHRHIYDGEQSPTDPGLSDTDRIIKGLTDGVSGGA